LLAGSRAAAIMVIQGDIRCPGQIFARQEVWNTIDFTQPVGVLFVAALHFIPVEDDPLISVHDRYVTYRACNLPSAINKGVPSGPYIHLKKGQITGETAVLESGIVAHAGQLP
jgi:hypothetical protein